MRHRPRRNPLAGRVMVAAALTAAIVACGGGSNSGGTPTAPSPSSSSTTFQGTFAGTDEESGTLDITAETTIASSFTRWRFPLVATLHAQTGGRFGASGSLVVIGGSTIPVAGTVDDNFGFNLAGGGYILTGK